MCTERSEYQSITLSEVKILNQYVIFFNRM